MKIEIPVREVVNTREDAAKIVELFEDLLDKHDITIPSPEDDDKEEDNNARLYGSVYYQLLDTIEEILLNDCRKVEKGGIIIPYKFS